MWAWLASLPKIVVAIKDLVVLTIRVIGYFKKTPQEEVKELHQAFKKASGNKKETHEERRKRAQAIKKAIAD